MRILVTGATGFVGRNLTPVLDQAGHDVLTPSKIKLDLMEFDRVLAYLRDKSPGAIVHLAAVCGGIEFNRRFPATLWHANTVMGANLLHACTRVKHPPRIVLVATTCGYPRVPKTIPFVEEEYWDGLPEPTNAPYGIAKRSLAAAAVAYRQQYGLDVRVLIPTNMYGPYDHFRDEGASHVIPALIWKIHRALQSPLSSLEVWGTGGATRDFLYAPDAAQAIRAAVEAENLKGGPINLGSGVETSISELVRLLCEIMEYAGPIEWLADRPDGQPRRVLDTTKAEHLLGWRAGTPLREGLIQTVEFFRQKVI